MMNQPRTPYHQLGSIHEPRVPQWAERRSVYRSAGRTLYLVETSKLHEASGDLQTLERSGWNVRVSPLSNSTASVAVIRDAA